MIYNTQRTIYSLGLQLDLLRKRKYTPLKGSTLNEYFDIIPNYTVADGLYPSLNYVVLGKGGIPGTNTLELDKYNNHAVYEASLYEHLPLYAVKLEDADTMPNYYRLKKVHTVGTTKYLVAYAMYVPTDTTTSYVEVNEATDEFKLLNLADKKVFDAVPDNDTNNLLIDPKKYITVLDDFRVNLTKGILIGINNASALLGIGSPNITELGLVSGVDLNTENGIEAAYAVINFYVNLDLSVTTGIASNGIDLAIAIGHSDPLYNF